MPLSVFWIRIRTKRTWIRNAGHYPHKTYLSLGFRTSLRWQCWGRSRPTGGGCRSSSPRPRTGRRATIKCSTTRALQFPSTASFARPNQVSKWTLSARNVGFPTLFFIFMKSCPKSSVYSFPPVYIDVPWTWTWTWKPCNTLESLVTHWRAPCNTLKRSL